MIATAPATTGFAMPTLQRCAAFTDTPLGGNPVGMMRGADGPIDAQMQMLTALRWLEDGLDPALPSRMAFAGARHRVLAAGTRARPADLDDDFGALKRTHCEHDPTIVDLVWRETQISFDAWSARPAGSVVEDPQDLRA